MGEFMTEAKRALEPLTSADCDLRDFAFMPLDIVRLFGSRFHAISSDAEWRAGVTLWLKSFHQVPAGSLPTDDIELCRLAELGRDLTSWEEIKSGALYGWVRCDDGRLYHPIVAEKANEAWKRKLAQRARSQKGNEARWGKRSKHGRDHGYESESLEGETGERENRPGHEREAHAEVPASESAKGSLRETRGESNKDFPQQSGRERLRESDGDSLEDSNKESLRDSFKDSPKDPKGQGQGQGYKKDIAAAAFNPPARDPVDNLSPPLAAAEQAPPARFAQLLGAWEHDRGKAAAFRPDDPLLLAWAVAGVSELELRAAYDRAVKRRTKTHDDAPVNPGLLDVMLPEVRHGPEATSALFRTIAAGDPLAWATTASGIAAKGAELGIAQGDSEIFPEFKARVHAAAGLTKGDRARLLADYGVRA